MPNFELREEEAIAIAAYLWSLSKEEGDQWTQEHALPAAFREGDSNEAAKGKKLVESIGCKGCHGFAEGEFTTVIGKDKDLVPNLKDIASKVGPQWTYHWIKNPRGFSPDTRMPSLRLSDDEARAITSYLMTLGSKPEPISGIEEKLVDAANIKSGESLVRKWGCFGCHDIKGMEKESRIGVESGTGVGAGAGVETGTGAEAMKAAGVTRAATGRCSWGGRSGKSPARRNSGSSPSGRSACSR
jgi:cytochrome c2